MRGPDEFLDKEAPYKGLKLASSLLQLADRSWLMSVVGQSVISGLSAPFRFTPISEQKADTGLCRLRA